MTLEVHWLCPVYSVTCFGGCYCKKLCFTQIGCQKWQQGFKCCGCDLKVSRHDFNPEHLQSCCFKRSFKAAVICNLQQLVFFLGHESIPYQFVGLLWVSVPVVTSFLRKIFAMALVFQTL